MVFKVRQEENPSYGLIGMEMAALSQQWLGGRGMNYTFLPVTLELLRHGLGVTD